MALDAAVVRNPSSITAGVTQIHPGASLGSYFPSISEINANYTYFNQVVALYKRRYYQLLGNTDFSVNYFTNTIPIANYLALRNGINTLRSYVGVSAYAWTNSYTTGSVGRPIKKADLDDLWTAFNFSSARTLFGYMIRPGTGTGASWGGMRAVYNPVGTLVSLDEDYGTVSTPSTTALLGSNRTGPTGGPYQNIRSIQRVGTTIDLSAYSPFLGLPANNSLTFSASGYGNTLGSFFPTLQGGLGDYSAMPANWWTHSGGTGAVWSYGATSVNISFAASNLQAILGSPRTFIIGSGDDLGGAYPSAPDGENREEFFTVSGAPTFTLDWGF